MTTKRKPSMDELFASMKEGCEATYYEYEVQLSKLTAQRDELRDKLAVTNATVDHEQRRVLEEIKNHNETKRERDELLAALKLIAELPKSHYMTDGGDRVHKEMSGIAQAVIAKAEGSKQ